MKVAISLAPLSSASQTRGVGVYTRELLRALQQNFPDSTFLAKDGNCYHDSVDLVHFPFFDPHFLTLPHRKPLPTIVTIHDLIPLKFASHFPPGLRGRLKYNLQKRSLRGVNHIITDSESSSRDIQEIMNVPESKITVVPLAPIIIRKTATLNSPIIKKYSLPPRYLLYVGDINWNKNVKGLINAFSQLNKPNLHLVIVGKVFSDKPDIPEYREIESLIAASPAKNRIKMLGYIPTHHMPYIYAHATLYVQPSWYEGFGLPILEAMNQGCPVLTSNQGSLPEVGGKSVAYFDPHSKKELLDSLKMLLRDSRARKKLSSQGQARARNFSWEKTARATYEVYGKVLTNTN